MAPPAPRPQHLKEIRDPLTVARLACSFPFCSLSATVLYSRSNTRLGESVDFGHKKINNANRDQAKKVRERFEPRLQTEQASKAT